jgi:tetratricopeptide (TPR) repeat protein
MTGSTDPDRAPTSPLPGNGMPILEVEALHVVGAPGQGDIAADSLIEKIKDAFARFDTINVASQSPPAEETLGAGSAAPGPRADYRLSGSVEYSGHGAALRFQLIDAREGTIAWSRRLTAERGDPPAAEGQVVVALTDALLQSYGVIRARDHAKQLASPAGDPRYRCVLDAAESFRSFQPADHERARDCLEHLTVAEPSFAVGFEFLAAIYYREYALGLRRSRDDRATLDLALRAARRALELNPESGRAYQMLFVVLFARGDLAAAFAAGEKAMALNRYDTTAMAEYGGRLILTGETTRGMAMLQRAGEPGDLRPGWQHFYMFLGYYLGGDMKEAASQADQITADGYPLGLVARAVTAHAVGDPKLARELVARLLDLAPRWRHDARGELARSIRCPASVDRLVQDLAAAGLTGAS